jgi:hypothetical protein
MAKVTAKIRPLGKIVPAKVSSKRILKSADVATQLVPDEQAIPLRASLRKRGSGLRKF